MLQNDMDVVNLRHERKVGLRRLTSAQLLAAPSLEGFEPPPVADRSGSVILSKAASKSRRLKSLLSRMCHPANIP